MSILIIGSDANAYSIAEYMSKNENVDIVFTTSRSEKIESFANFVDISENDTDNLLDFVIANDIDLTVVTSMIAIENNIAGCFENSGRLIFAPSSESAGITIFKSLAKKMMYKLKIPTIKFGIFERENQAIDYVYQARRPLIIKNDTQISDAYPVLTNSFSKAKSVIEKLFISPENKIIIEDYIDAQKVSLYYITDGYSALKIGNCISYDENLSYMDNYISNSNILSSELDLKILNEVVYPILDDISFHNQSYSGILGVDLLVNENYYNVIEFYPFFKQMHLQTILPNIKTDLYCLFLSVANGSFSDEYEFIDTNNYSCVSRITNNFDENKLSYINDDNLTYAYTTASNIILTQIAQTTNRARKNLEENIQFISKEGD